MAIDDGQAQPELVDDMSGSLPTGDANGAAGTKTRRLFAAIPRSSLAVAATAIIVFAAGLLRQVGVPKVQTIWAEDGRVFLQCVYDSSGLGCVGEPYQGYLRSRPPGHRRR